MPRARQARGAQASPGEPLGTIMVLVRERVADGSILQLIWSWLKAGYLDENGAHQRTDQGVPQGGPLSPLLSNVYLNLLDRLWERRGYPEKLGAKLYRYADDMVLLCRGNPRAAHEALAALVGRMGLTLHPDKTRTVRVEEGFDFLSFHFVRRRSPTTGKRSFYIFPAKDSQAHIRENLRNFTHRRAPVKPQELLKRINDVVRGWVNYFQHTNASQAFRGLQRFINLRVRRYLSQRHRERGTGWKRYPARKLYAMGLGDFRYAFEYYFQHIMRPFKRHVLDALALIEPLELAAIAPSHGPILRDRPRDYVARYRELSTPRLRRETDNGDRTLIVFYISSYGNTRRMAEAICDGASEVPGLRLSLYDLEGTPVEPLVDLVEEADAILIGSPTINGDAVKPVWDLLSSFAGIHVQGKVAGAFGSYGWSGEAVRMIEDRLRGLKLRVPVAGVKVKLIPAREEILACREFGRQVGEFLIGRQQTREIDFSELVSAA